MKKAWPYPGNKEEKNIEEQYVVILWYAVMILWFHLVLSGIIESVIGMLMRG